nr:MAG TPA: KilAC domain protein [Caudoviricetes sp.]
MLAMREVRRFENQQLGRIRAVKDGERWLFCGYDVVKALGYSTSGASAVVNRLCNDIMRFPDLVSHKQLPLNFVSEEDVHRILQCSRSPKINAFEVWFESEILPSLYGHSSLVPKKNDIDGNIDTTQPDTSLSSCDAYLTPEALEAAILNPDYLLKIVTALKQETDKSKALEIQVAAQAKIIKDQKSMLDVVQKASQTENLISISEFAKVLRDEKIDIGQNRLLKFLRKNKFLKKGDLPYQCYINKGYFIAKEFAVETVEGTKTSLKTYITKEGQRFLSKEIQKYFDCINDNQTGGSNFEA